MITAMIIAVIVLMLLGFPLFAGAGVIAAISFFFYTDVPLKAMITQINFMTQQPVLCVFPVFTFMGYILNYGKSSQRLATLAESFLSWLPGGLAISSVLAYSVFSALTGGSFLPVLALGGLYYTALKKSGYNENFSLGICTVMGGGGILFPPSLPIFIMAFTAGLSIDVLFASGFLPGITVIFIFIIYCIFNSARTSVPRTPFSFKKAFEAIKDVALELPVGIIIIGGIFFGWMTVNEVAILSLVYIIFAECVVRREVSFKDLRRAGVDSMVLVGAIFAIMGSALILSNFFIDYEIPQKVVILLKSYFTSRVAFLLLMNVILLVTGCVIDIFSAILVMVPLLLPVAVAYGIDPVHFGIIFIWNLEIGFSTPPFGFNLFVGSFRFKKPLDALWRAAIPGVMLQVVGLILITYVPWLTEWLPGVLGLKKMFINM